MYALITKDILLTKLLIFLPNSFMIDGLKNQMLIYVWILLNYVMHDKLPWFVDVDPKNTTKT